MQISIRRMLFFLLVILLFFHSILQLDSFSGAKEKTGNLQRQPSGTLETKIDSGLFRGIFTLPDRGTTFFNLPYTMSAGEVVSGTIITQPSGRNDAERSKNQEELDKYSIEIASQKFPANNRSFQLSVPAPQSGSTTVMIVRDGRGREVGQANIPIALEPQPPMTEFILPTFGQVGEFIEIVGPFDGVFSPSDWVREGGEHLLVAAESKTTKIAFNNRRTVGPTELEVNEGGHITRSNFQNVAINMFTANPHLLKNQETDLRVQASGLDGLQVDVPLNVQNISPSLLKMEGGDRQTFVIRPEDVQAGGHYTIVRRLTGIEVGAYSIKANLKRACSFTVALYNADTSDAYKQVRISAVGSTKITEVDAAPWLQQSNMLPYSVLLGPASPSAIPAGTHMLTISVEFNYAGGGQQLWVEWMVEGGRILCRQLIDVSCGVRLVPVVSQATLDPAKQPPPTAKLAPGVKDGIIESGETVTGRLSGCRHTRAFVVNDSSASAKLQAEADCEASFVVSQVPGCNTYLFTNTSTYDGGAPPSYTWYVLDENGNFVHQENSTNFTYNFPDSGTYTVLLTAYGMACGGETDIAESYEITIPPLKPDFTWASKECGNPLTLEFANQSQGEGLKYEWNIAGTQSTLKNPTHTFPGEGEYNVYLKVTDLSGSCQQQECKIVKVSKGLNPDFDWEYCLTDPKKITVTFTNKSTGGECPIKYKWEFGDNTLSSNQTGPKHDYTKSGQFTVRLTMTDSAKPPNTAVKEHIINIKACSPEFSVNTCPDGDVLFTTDVKHPQWEFPDGEKYFYPLGYEWFSSKTKRFRFDTPGTYSASMSAKDDNNCKCTVTKRFTIDKIECCARTDKDKIHQKDFTIGDTEYRMSSKLVVRNILGMHYVKAKTILRKKVLGVYVRTKAAEIRTNWSGMIYKSKDGCCCVTPDSTERDTGIIKKKTKAKTIHWINEKFRARKHTITSTHYVKVDDRHPAQIITLKLGEDCDRCRRP